MLHEPADRNAGSGAFWGQENLYRRHLSRLFFGSGEHDGAEECDGCAGRNASHYETATGTLGVDLFLLYVHDRRGDEGCSSFGVEDGE